MVFTSGLPLEEDLTPGSNLGFMTHLDFRVTRKIRAGETSLSNVSSDVEQHLDYFPYDPTDFPDGALDSAGSRIKIIDRATGMEIAFTRATTTDAGIDYITNANQLQVTATATERDVFVGVTYDMQYTFAEKIFKTASGGRNKTPTKYTNTKVRNGNVFFDNTAFFQIKVTPENRDTYTNEYTTQTVGGSTLNRIDLKSGSFRFPVFTKPESTTITIENGSAYPSTFQGAEFESFVHQRSSRYA